MENKEICLLKRPFCKFVMDEKMDEMNNVPSRARPSLTFPVGQTLIISKLHSFQTLFSIFVELDWNFII